jgi:hypothetical protein
MTLYRKKGLTEMRPYVMGENLDGVSVSDEDTPEKGGMIANDPSNQSVKWYVSKDYFQKNYEEAL